MKNLMLALAMVLAVSSSAFADGTVTELELDRLVALRTRTIQNISRLESALRKERTVLEQVNGGVLTIQKIKRDEEAESEDGAEEAEAEPVED